jgi:hypothetical protein
MSRLTLYHTVGCHLCEEAEALVLACVANPDCMKKTDIAEDDALLARYGLSIPVLRNHDSGRELNWPFGAGDVQAFCKPPYAA